MREQGPYRNFLADAFRMPDAPMLTTRVLSKSIMCVTELRCDRPHFGQTASMPREDAYLVALQMWACPNHDLFFDGRRVQPINYQAGVTSIYDLRCDPVADIRDPFHCLMFHLPRRALDIMADEAGLSRVGDLRHQPGVSVNDPVVRHLLSTLRLAIAKPQEAHSLFLDHVALALCAHIAHVYGGMNQKASLPGGLAPWQERRVKELMSTNFKEEFPLSRLATECGLSVRHFARAFRQSTGVPPHRWLLQYRVEQAKALLRKRSLCLTSVALSCGFADQTHFTRVFTAVVGVSPGAWRRRNTV